MIRRSRVRVVLALASALSFAVFSSSRAAAQGFPQEIGEADRKHDPAHTPGAESELDDRSWWEHDHLLFGVGGARRSWAEAGFDFEILVSSEASRVLRGGLDTSRTPLRHLIDAQAVFDAQSLWGLEGGELLVLAQYQDGDEGGPVVGDAQGYSNIDADGRAQISKLWWYQEFVDARLWTKVGKIDVNSDFAYTDYGAPFLSSSLGYSPTLVGFPTYPDPSFGAQIAWEFREDWRLSAGTFDGEANRGVATGSRGPSTLFSGPDDLFSILELDFGWSAQPNVGPGRVGLGAWYHSGEFARFDGGRQSGTHGFYLVGDTTLFGAPEKLEELGLFAQFGNASDEVSELSQHLSLGAHWRGAIPGRPLDEFGLAVSSVEFSDAAGAGFSAQRETAVEWFASFAVAPWLRVKPDLQFIDEPGGNGTRDAWVATIRTTISL